MTNALGQTRERRSNAICQLVEVTDHLGTSIEYACDPFGNLVETDAGGTVTTMDYDLLGLNTGMSDPGRVVLRRRPPRPARLPDRRTR